MPSGGIHHPVYHVSHRGQSQVPPDFSRFPHRLVISPTGPHAELESGQQAGNGDSLSGPIIAHAFTEPARHVVELIIENGCSAPVVVEVNLPVLQRSWLPISRRLAADASESLQQVCR